MFIVLKDIFSEFKEGVFDLPPLVGKQSCSVHHFTAIVQQRHLPICLAILVLYTVHQEHNMGLAIYSKDASVEKISEKISAAPCVLHLKTGFHQYSTFGRITLPLISALGPPLKTRNLGTRGQCLKQGFHCRLGGACKMRKRRGKRVPWENIVRQRHCSKHVSCLTPLHNLWFFCLPFKRWK